MLVKRGRSLHIEIHSERILSKFARLAHEMREKIYRIWIVSPWITHENTDRDPLITLALAAKPRNPAIVVITRPPEKNSEEHNAALHMLHSIGNTTTFTMPRLHSKIYLLHCDGFRAAFLGSPNFTVSGNIRNEEIAIDLRSNYQDKRDKVGSLISELNDYVSSLRTEATLDWKRG